MWETSLTGKCWSHDLRAIWGFFQTTFIKIIFWIWECGPWLIQLVIILNSPGNQIYLENIVTRILLLCTISTVRVLLKHKQNMLAILRKSGSICGKSNRSNVLGQISICSYLILTWNIDTVSFQTHTAYPTEYFQYLLFAWSFQYLQLFCLSLCALLNEELQLSILVYLMSDNPNRSENWIESIEYLNHWESYLISPWLE